MSRVVPYLEIVGLKGQAPARQTCVVILQAVQPLERTVISLDGEFSTEEIDTEVMGGCLDSETFFLDGRVACFPWKQFAAVVGNWMFDVVVVLLTEDGSNTPCRRISL